MKNKKRNWSSTSLLDSSAYTRFSRENFGTNNFKQEFFPNNETSDEKSEKLIINPESAWKLIWDCLIFCIILYQAISTPYFIAFSIDVTFGSIYYSDLCFTGLFLVDIVFCFNLAFFHNGDLIENRKEIIKNYLKSWFWIDIISTFPYDIIYDSKFYSISPKQFSSKTSANNKILETIKAS